MGRHWLRWPGPLQRPRRENKGRRTVLSREEGASGMYVQNRSIGCCIPFTPKVNAAVKESYHIQGRQRGKPCQDEALVMSGARNASRAQEVDHFAPSIHFIFIHTTSSLHLSPSLTTSRFLVFFLLLLSQPTLYHSPVLPSKLSQKLLQGFINLSFSAVVLTSASNPAASPNPLLLSIPPHHIMASEANYRFGTCLYPHVLVA